jgi:hypothetical protein
MNALINKIKNLLGLGHTHPSTAPDEAEAAAADEAKSSFLANQSKDRAAKLREVQDKAAQGAAD